MIIAKNDEEKRSRIWRIVTFGTTVLIIVLVIFFVTKLFTANPLEGTWRQKGTGLSFAIQDGGSVMVKWKDAQEGGSVKIKLNYSLDKETKIFTIKENEAELQKAAKSSDGRFTEEGLRSVISPMVTSFDYSVDQKVLTLTEREYGERMIFTKK